MKLQAVMENLHRQQRAKLLMEQQLQQQQAASQQTQVRGGDEPIGSPAPEAEQAQMAALAAMRAVAAGLKRVSDSPMSENSSGGEEEHEDDNDEGEEQYKEMMGSDEEEQIKQKWDEEDFEGEMEEDFDEDMAEEGLPTGHDAVAPGKGILLLPHRQLHPHGQLLKVRPSMEQEPRSGPHASPCNTQPPGRAGPWRMDVRGAVQTAVRAGCRPQKERVFRRPLQFHAKKRNSL
ncbi:hypothetical protein FQA47_010078 [Oryzias melastigma]|uniref:Uncharacterized protein n=1 Tax=Oryzias melastigma TaxID=30732 RepID=A0A834FHN5_ORYME|nr:hypothetical protein FQA47_010078 [Oryzias melastigma]